MGLNMIKFLLVLLLINYSNAQAAFGKNKIIPTSSLSNDSHFSSDLIKTSNVQLVDVVSFDMVDSSHNLWRSGHYIFQCDSHTGYDCELAFNERKKIEVNLFKDYDVNDFLPYIYQSKIKDYQYKVVLIEALAERGTSWYYAIVLKNNNVIDSFFIDQGRRYFPSTKEYLASHPEADEMYINPKEFISISINDGLMIFKLDKKYLYSDEESESRDNKDFIYIQKKLK